MKCWLLHCRTFKYANILCFVILFIFNEFDEKHYFLSQEGEKLNTLFSNLFFFCCCFSVQNATSTKTVYFEGLKASHNRRYHILTNTTFYKAESSFGAFKMHWTGGIWRIYVPSLFGISAPCHYALKRPEKAFHTEFWCL